MIDAKDFFNNLNPTLQAALSRYKTNDPFNGSFAYAIHINNILKASNPINDKWENEIELLDKLTRIFKINEEITVFRTCKHSELERFIHNNKLKYPAFLSTSTDADSTGKFLQKSNDNTLLEIMLPNKTYIAPMDGMKGETGEENEILLPRNCDFIINDKTTISNGDEIKKYYGMNSIWIDKFVKIQLSKIPVA